MKMSITWTKLKDGTYGVRSTVPLTEGMSATVAKRDGTTSEVTIGRVLWTGADKSTGQPVWLAAIERKNSAARSSSHGGMKRAERQDRYNASIEQQGGNTFDDDIPF